MDVVDRMRMWMDVLRGEIPGLEVFDAHTHLGQNDPDGMSCTFEELTGGLMQAGAKGAFVFPMHEPDGYPAANDMVIAAADQAGGVLTPFCRVNPNAGNALA